MLEDWVDDAEIEATRSVPTGAGLADEARADEAAVDASARAPGRRRAPRIWRLAWFTLLAFGLAVVGMDEIPDWVPTELQFGIDKLAELAGPDRWAGLFIGAAEDDTDRDADEPGPPRDEASGRLVDQTFSGENVLPRDAWRAAPLLSSTDELGKPWRITVHHSGGGVLTTDDLSRTARRIRAIQRDHQEQRRWVDIAYHYIVDRAGRVWEGRSTRWVGAHAGSSGANLGNLGVLVLGNFDEQAPPPVQIRALTRLIESLGRRHGIAPARVFTHAEVRESHGMATTDCPGRDLAGWVQTYRRGGPERETRDGIGD